MVGAITLQVPYKLSPVPAPNGSGTASADVVVTQNGSVSKAFTVFVTLDNLHVLSISDSFPSKQSAICSSVVTHAEGTLVTVNLAHSFLSTVGASGLDAKEPAVSGADRHHYLRPLCAVFNYSGNKNVRRR